VAFALTGEPGETYPQHRDHGSASQLPGDLQRGALRGLAAGDPLLFPERFARARPAYSSCSTSSGIYSCATAQARSHAFAPARTDTAQEHSNNRPGASGPRACSPKWCTGQAHLAMRLLP